MASGSHGAAPFEWVADWVERFAAAVHEQREGLTALDSAIGDADHGANLDRGMTSALQAVAALEDPAPATVLTTVGMTLVSTVGGASGPLFGTMFLRMGAALRDVDSAAPETIAAVLQAGLDGVVARGKAESGDKTMFDALAPAVDAFRSSAEAGASLADGFAAAARAAEDGLEATVAMTARKGRASYLGERSVGHADPGAASVALLMAAAHAAVPVTA